VVYVEDVGKKCVRGGTVFGKKCEESGLVGLVMVVVCIIVAIIIIAIITIL
jgi:type IV secretory pathway VirB3-like protein